MKLNSDVIDIVELRKILQDLPLTEKLCAGLSSEKDATTTAAKLANMDQNEYLNAALLDLMRRYGRVKTEIFEHAAKDAEDQHIDRVVHGRDWECAAPVAAMGGMSIVNSQREVLVRLRIERARGIGRVDFRNGADLFCVTFLGDWRGGRGLHGKLDGNRLFQTEVKRGKNEQDWTWDEVCSPVSSYM